MINRIAIALCMCPVAPLWVSPGPEASLSSSVALRMRQNERRERAVPLSVSRYTLPVDSMLITPGQSTARQLPAALSCPHYIPALYRPASARSRSRHTHPRRGNDAAAVAVKASRSWRPDRSDQPTVHAEAATAGKNMYEEELGWLWVTLLWRFCFFPPRFLWGKIIRPHDLSFLIWILTLHLE